MAKQKFTTIRIYKEDRQRLDVWKAQMLLCGKGSLNDADFVKEKLNDEEEKEAGVKP